MSAVAAAEGWVLAGGESRRMGRDKAAMPLAGRTLLAHMLGKLQALGLPPRVAGLRNPVAGLAAPVLPDVHPGSGPLSGLEVALTQSAAPMVLALSVDLPLVEPALLAWMLERAAITGAVATIPRVLGRPEPLCAVYRREILPAVTEALEAGERKVMRVMAQQEGNEEGRGKQRSVDLFDAERIATAGGWSCLRPLHLQFLNCNTPRELAQAETLLASAPML